MELRNDLEFTRAQLVEAQEKVKYLNHEVLLLTQNNMQLQLNEKDLQALITADEIHKQIFLERDQTKAQLEEAKKELSEKQLKLQEKE